MLHTRESFVPPTSQVLKPEQLSHLAAGADPITNTDRHNHMSPHDSCGHVIGHVIDYDFSGKAGKAISSASLYVGDEAHLADVHACGARRVCAEQAQGIEPANGVMV